MFTMNKLASLVKEMNHTSKASLQLTDRIYLFTIYDLRGAICTVEKLNKMYDKCFSIDVNTMRFVDAVRRDYINAYDDLIDVCENFIRLKRDNYVPKDVNLQYAGYAAEECVNYLITLSSIEDIKKDLRTGFSRETDMAIRRFREITMSKELVKKVTDMFNASDYFDIFLDQLAISAVSRVGQLSGSEAINCLLCLAGYKTHWEDKHHVTYE